MPAAWWPLVLLAASLPLACGPPRDAQGPWSLLLVTVDTLRPDYLGAGGYDRDSSPAIDRLLAEGFTFERATTPMGRTTPALASLLTGAYPHRTGVRTLTGTLSDGVVPFTEVLREAGYQTLAVVSNEVLLPGRRLKRGFEIYDLHTNIRRAQATTDAALGYLELADRSRPVFVWVHYIDPHLPYHPPDAALAEAFDPDYRGPYEHHFGWMPTPEEGRDAYRAFPPDLPKQDAVFRNALPPRVNEHIRRLYAADVRGTDDAIGPLVDAVRTGWPDRTIVVFTSDHGESLGEHDFFYDHGDYVYNSCTRVPLGIVLPNRHPLHGRGLCPDWVSLVDVAPTLLELLDLEPPAGMVGQLEGRSLVPCLRGEPLPPAPVFSESGFSYYPGFVKRRVRFDVSGRLRSVTLGDWKLIWAPYQEDESLAWELYDVARDPHETRNLYRPGHPRVPELREALFAWKERAVDGERAPELSERDKRVLRQLGYLR